MPRRSGAAPCSAGSALFLELKRFRIRSSGDRAELKGREARSGFERPDMDRSLGIHQKRKLGNMGEFCLVATRRRRILPRHVCVEWRDVVTARIIGLQFLALHLEVMWIIEFERMVHHRGARYGQSALH